MAMGDRIRIAGGEEAEGFKGFAAYDPDVLLNQQREAEGQTSFKPELTLGRAGGAVIEELKGGVRDRLVGVGLIEESVEDRARAFRKRRGEEIKSLQKKLGQDKHVKRDEEMVKYRDASTEILAAAAGERLKADPAFQVTSGWLEDQIRSLTQVGQQIATAAIGGPAVSLPDMALMIMGGSYDRWVKEGADPARAKTAAFANAIVQSPMEYLGISKVAKLFRPKQNVVRFLKEIGTIGGVEGLTEYLQNMGPEMVAELWAKNPDKNIFKMWSNVLAGYEADDMERKGPRKWEGHKESLKGAAHAAVSSMAFGTGRARRKVKEQVRQERYQEEVEREAAEMPEDEMLAEEEKREQEKIQKKIDKRKKDKRKREKKPTPRSSEPMVDEKIREEEEAAEIEEEIEEEAAAVEEALPEEVVEEEVEEETAVVEDKKIDPFADVAEPETVEEEPAPEPTPVVDKVPSYPKITGAGIRQEDGTVIEQTEISGMVGVATKPEDMDKITETIAHLSGQGKGEAVFLTEDGQVVPLEALADQKVLKDLGGTGEEDFEGFKKAAEESEELGEKRADVKDVKQTERKEQVEKRIADVKKVGRKKLNKTQQKNFDSKMPRVKRAVMRSQAVKGGKYDTDEVIQEVAVQLDEWVRMPKKERVKRRGVNPKTGELREWSPKFAIQNAIKELQARRVGLGGVGRGTVQRGEAPQMTGLTQDIAGEIVKEPGKGQLVEPDAVADTKAQHPDRPSPAAKAKQADALAVTEQEAVEAKVRDLGVKVGATPAETLDNLETFVDVARGPQLSLALKARKDLLGTIKPAKEKFVLSTYLKSLSPNEREAAKAEILAEREREIARGRKTAKAEQEKVTKFQEKKGNLEPKVAYDESGNVAKGTGFLPAEMTENEKEKAKSREALGISGTTVAKAPEQWDTAQTEREGTNKGNPWKSEEAAKKQLAKRKKDNPERYQYAHIVGSGKWIKPVQARDKDGKLKWDEEGQPVWQRKGHHTKYEIEVRQPIGQKRILPDDVSSKPLPPGEWRSVDRDIKAIDKSRADHDRAIKEALKLKKGTPEYIKKIANMKKRVEKRKRQIATLEARYQNTKTRKKVKSAKQALANNIKELQDLEWLDNSMKAAELDMKPVVKMVKVISPKTKVVVFPTAESIPNNIKKVVEARGKTPEAMRGAYNNKTNTVYLVANKFKSKRDAATTAIHEIVHRRVNKFKRLFGKIFKNNEAAVRSIAKKKGITGGVKAVDEWLALEITDQIMNTKGPVSVNKTIKRVVRESAEARVKEKVAEKERNLNLGRGMEFQNRMLATAKATGERIKREARVADRVARAEKLAAEQEATEGSDLGDMTLKQLRGYVSKNKLNARAKSKAELLDKIKKEERIEASLIRDGAKSREELEAMDKEGKKSKVDQMIEDITNDPFGVVKNEKGGGEIHLPGLKGKISIKKLGAAWTAAVDKRLGQGAEKTRAVARTSTGIDTVLTAFVNKFGLEPTYKELQQDKKQANHKLNVAATRISKAIERIDSDFGGKKVSEKTKQRRLLQIAEGSITSYGEKTVALREAVREFQKMEKELRKRGMLGDHQFRKLNKREIAKALDNPNATKQEDFGVKQLDEAIIKESLSAKDEEQIEKRIKKLNTLRTDLLARIQIHYKNSGVNYIRHIKAQVDQNESYMRRFTMDAMSNKWSKRRQNWVTSEEDGIVKVRRPKPTKKSKKEWYPVAELVQKGLNQEAHDMHLFDLFSNIAKSEEDFKFVKGEATGPWATTDPTKYPGMRYHNKPMPKIPAFGPLGGMHLEKHIYESLKHDIEEVSEFTRATRKIFRNWKGFKTVWNPATQTRNFISNMALADVVGDVNFLSPKTYVHWKQAFKDAAQVNKGLEPTSQYGREILHDTTIHENTFARAELGESDVIQKMGEAFASEVSHVGIAKLLKFAASSGPRAYQLMEVTMKSVVYSSARDRGMNIIEAAKLAEEALFDYSDVPSGIRWARNYYQPFVTFTYKAAPAVAKAVVRKPWKLAKYYGMVYGAQMLSGMMLGEDDEEQEAKKRNLPDYMRRDMLPGMPSHIRVPFKSSDGKDKWMDLSFILPWGALSEMGEGPLSWVPQALLPNTPLLTVPAALLTNTDVFLMKPISLETDTQGEKIWKTFARIAKEAAPGVISPDKMSKIVGAFYGDKNLFGQKNYSVADAVLDWGLGIKLRNMNYMEQAMWRSKDLQKKATLLRSEYKKKMQKVMITQENRHSGNRDKMLHSIQEEFHEKMDDIIEELHYRSMKESDDE